MKANASDVGDSESDDRPAWSHAAEEMMVFVDSAPAAGRQSARDC